LELSGAEDKNLWRVVVLEEEEITCKSVSEQQAHNPHLDLYMYDSSFHCDFLIKRLQSELSNTMWLQNKGNLHIPQQAG